MILRCRYYPGKIILVDSSTSTYTAFLGEAALSSGAIESVAPVLKEQFLRDPGALVLVFEDATGRQVDFDWRVPADVPAARTGPGRPKLGVVSREVTLLPRHWEWLEQQSGGASAALRRLVDQARKHESGEQRMRLAREAAGRFMTAMAGNYPEYEEATRALWAGNRAGFDARIAQWPADVRRYCERLASEAFT